MINKYLSRVIYLIFFILVGCNTSSTNTNVNCSSTKQQIACEGGYSYWIGSHYGMSSNTLAVTGVVKEGDKSKQWLSFFSDDLSEQLAMFSFDDAFYADEHNAPAILANDDGSWLMVRTGHNDTFEQGKGKLYVYSISSELKITNEIQLATTNGATYAQLVNDNQQTYLLTRDTNRGWGLFISDDKGITWGDWQPLWRENGHRYILMQGFGFDEFNNKKLIFSNAFHPNDKIQKISYVVVAPKGLNKELLSASLAPINNPLIINDNTISYEVESESRSNVRFLDAANYDNNVCHLYTSINMTTNSWDLHLTGHHLAKNNKHDYYLGKFNGVLGDSTYVTGASIGSCKLNDGEQFDVFVANQDESKDYIISHLSVDAQSGDILKNDEVVRSKKQLYRPIYIDKLNYLMFNEAEYWTTYNNWLATQKIIKLP